MNHHLDPIPGVKMSSITTQLPPAAGKRCQAKLLSPDEIGVHLCSAYSWRCHHEWSIIRIAPLVQKNVISVWKQVYHSLPTLIPICFFAQTLRTCLAFIWQCLPPFTCCFDSLCLHGIGKNLRSLSKRSPFEEAVLEGGRKHDKPSFFCLYSLGNAILEQSWESRIRWVCGPAKEYENDRTLQEANKQINK